MNIDFSDGSFILMNEFNIVYYNRSGLDVFIQFDQDVYNITFDTIEESKKFFTSLRDLMQIDNEDWENNPYIYINAKDDFEWVLNASEINFCHMMYVIDAKDSIYRLSGNDQIMQYEMLRLFPGWEEDPNKALTEFINLFYNYGQKKRIKKDHKEYIEKLLKIFPKHLEGDELFSRIEELYSQILDLNVEELIESVKSYSRWLKESHVLFVNISNLPKGKNQVSIVFKSETDARYYSEIFKLKFKHWVKNVISDNFEVDNDSDNDDDERM